MTLFYLLKSRLYNFTDLKIYSPNLYVLTLLTIIVTLTFLESVTSLHNSTLSLSLRVLKFTAKNVSDFEVGRTEISGQRELTEGRRAPWELTAYTVHCELCCL